jgi:hypothetical protein
MLGEQNCYQAPERFIEAELKMQNSFQLPEWIIGVTHISMVLLLHYHYKTVTSTPLWQTDQ